MYVCAAPKKKEDKVYEYSYFPQNFIRSPNEFIIACKCRNQTKVQEKKQTHREIEHSHTYYSELDSE